MVEPKTRLDLWTVQEYLRFFKFGPNQDQIPFYIQPTLFYPVKILKKKIAAEFGQIIRNMAVVIIQVINNLRNSEQLKHINMLSQRNSIHHIRSKL